MVFEAFKDTINSKDGRIIFISVLVSSLTTIFLLNEDLNIRGINLIKNAIIWIGIDLSSLNPTSFFYFFYEVIRIIDLVIEVGIAIFLSIICVGVTIYFLDWIINRIRDIIDNFSNP